MSQPHGRIFNFSAGPAVLPVDVLEKAQKDLVNWNGSGMSIMEMSHRGPQYMAVQAKAEADLRALLNIPANYKVLFLQGGATTQFSAIPLNLTQPGDTVDQLITGAWSKKAQEEAAKYCKVNVVCKGDNKSIPEKSTWKLSPEATYVHLCSNETIQGVEFKEDPDFGGKILIADMSSNILSKPVDVSKYGVIYAGAQKNIGPAGVAIVIVREDLIGHARKDIPIMLDWKVRTCHIQSKYAFVSCSFPCLIETRERKEKEKERGLPPAPSPPRTRCSHFLSYFPLTPPLLTLLFFFLSPATHTLRMYSNRPTLRTRACTTRPPAGRSTCAASCSRSCSGREGSRRWTRSTPRRCVIACTYSRALRVAVFFFSEHLTHPGLRPSSPRVPAASPSPHPRPHQHHIM
jgi:hypothetical protein